MNREARRHPTHPLLPRPEECGRVTDRVIKKKPDTSPKPVNNVKRRPFFMTK